MTKRSYLQVIVAIAVASSLAGYAVISQVANSNLSGAGLFGEAQATKGKDDSSSGHSNNNDNNNSSNNNNHQNDENNNNSNNNQGTNNVNGNNNNNSNDNKKGDDDDNSDQGGSNSGNNNNHDNNVNNNSNQDNDIKGNDDNEETHSDDSYSNGSGGSESGNNNDDNNENSNDNNEDNSHEDDQNEQDNDDKPSKDNHDDADDEENDNGHDDQGNGNDDDNGCGNDDKDCEHGPLAKVRAMQDGKSLDEGNEGLVPGNDIDCVAGIAGVNTADEVKCYLVPDGIPTPDYKTTPIPPISSTAGGACPDDVGFNSGMECFTATFNDTLFENGHYRFVAEFYKDGKMVGLKGCDFFANHSFFVVPESPIGSLALMLSSIAATGGFLAFRGRGFF